MPHARRIAQRLSLPAEKAKDLGIVGVAGRASGIDLDVRRDHPYAAYRNFSFKIPVYQAGDVWHRMQVRIDEIREALNIVRSAAERELRAEYCAPPRPIPLAVVPVPF